jgi:hypothetical protein
MFAFFLAVPLWYLARRQRAVFAVPIAEAGRAASGGLISLAAYGAIIWAMQASAMGAVSALRETGVVFAASLGAVFLNARLTGLRIAACWSSPPTQAAPAILTPARRMKTPRCEPGRFDVLPRVRWPKRPQSFLRKPENFFWNRDTRPPRSSSCWAPPIQAGCDLESISRFSLSPALPQVDRVWYSVPSVITTVII